MKKLCVLIVALLAMVTISGCTDKPAPSTSSQLSAEPSSATVLPSLPPPPSVAEPSEGKELDKDLIYEMYGKDIFKSAIASQTWEDATQIRPEFLVNFFSNRTELYRLSTDAVPAIVPAELLESFVQLHFNVEAEHIRKAIYYNKEDNTYGLPIYSGGPGTSKVIGASLEGNRMTISYEQFGPESETIAVREGIFVMELRDRWHYKYISGSAKNLS